MEVPTTRKRRLLMDKVTKKLVTWFVKPALTIYLQKDRTFTYKGLTLVIKKGVFHPGFFFSSKYLTSFVEGLKLRNKIFLEPCSGSGLISLVAGRMGANVTCFDINPEAVENIKINHNLNKLAFSDAKFTVLQSDLFESIPVTPYDIIVLNPPYFFKEYNNYEIRAWNAGAKGEFFHSFFSQLRLYTHNSSDIYIVLADNCEFGKIETIARSNGWKLLLKEQKKILWETNYIYQIVNM